MNGQTAPSEELRQRVRDKYAATARTAAAGETPSCGPANEGGTCCGPAPVELNDRDGNRVFGSALYGNDAAAPKGAVQASMGCGVPTAVADLHSGETVLDLGSGAGADVLISARRVGETGKAIGLDMTDEMLDLALANAAMEGVSNVEFLKGYIEDIPLADGSVDVVLSNCVINLAADKGKVIAEAARVLAPGGRFAVSDVIALPEMDEATRADMEQWTGCIAGALTRDEFESLLVEAGLEDVEIRETHAVHEFASSAIIRARKPGEDGCCSSAELGACCEPAAKSECCGEAAPREAPQRCGCST
jgi:arsenite methyltransferase